MTYSRRKRKITPLPPTGLPGTGTTPPKDTLGYTVDIKVATSNLFLNDVGVIDEGVMTDLVFEDIGGDEIINIARSGTINGQDVIYQPIKNISTLSAQYNSKNLLQIEGSADSIFNNFPLKLDYYVPIDTDLDPINGVEPVYIEPYSGNIIINLINMSNGEQVEVEIIKTGTAIDDTIY